jgi:hypothetical protein
MGEFYPLSFLFGIYFTTVCPAETAEPTFVFNDAFWGKEVLFSCDKSYLNAGTLPESIFLLMDAEFTASSMNV